MRTSLSVLLLLAAACGHQRSPALPVPAPGWHVTTVRIVDSVITAAVDTARGEPSFCLGVDIDRAAKNLFVWQAAAATLVGGRQTRGMTTFSCPPEAAIAHGHFLSAGAVDGPSDADLEAIKRLPVKPPAALVIVVDPVKRYRFVVYHVQPESPDRPQGKVTGLPCVLCIKQ